MEAHGGIPLGAGFAGAEAPCRVVREDHRRGGCDPHDRWRGARPGRGVDRAIPDADRGESRPGGHHAGIAAGFAPGRDCRVDSGDVAPRAGDGEQGHLRGVPAWSCAGAMASRRNGRRGGRRWGEGSSLGKVDHAGTKAICSCTGQGSIRTEGHSPDSRIFPTSLQCVSHPGMRCRDCGGSGDHASAGLVGPCCAGSEVPGGARERPRTARCDFQARARWRDHAMDWRFGRSGRLLARSEGHGDRRH